MTSDQHDRPRHRSDERKARIWAVGSSLWSRRAGDGCSVGRPSQMRRRTSSRGAGDVIAALVIGAAGYGLSITLWVRGAREIGAARGQVIFATAPFIGAAIAWTVLGDTVGGLQIVATPPRRWRRPRGSCRRRRPILASSRPKARSFSNWRRGSSAITWPSNPSADHKRPPARSPRREPAWCLRAGEGVEPSVVDQPGRPSTANRSASPIIMRPSSLSDNGRTSPLDARQQRSEFRPFDLERQTPCRCRPG